MMQCAQCPSAPSITAIMDDGTHHHGNGCHDFSDTRSSSREGLPRDPPHPGGQQHCHFPPAIDSDQEPHAKQQRDTHG